MNLTYSRLSMRQFVWLLASFFFITILSAQPVIGTTTFDGSNSNIATYDILPRSGAVQGWSFFVDGEGSGSINHNGAITPSTVTVFAQQATSLNMISNDGSEFDLEHIVIQWFNFSGNFTMTSYKDGNSIASVVLNATSSYSDYNLSNNDNFKNIDEIRLDGFGNSNITAIIDEITISAVTLSIEGVDYDENSITIYPNPTNDFVTVTNIKNSTGYQIIDLNGRIVIKGKINQNNNIINLNNLTSGLYVLKLDNKNPIKTLKI